ncbi:rhodanese-like domain-containing protein [Alkaliphilus hydrothermalis]|uniref:thiosulfate sulfurtransferase n=1 Tax=Alkaliphilus hydrothermalis TaxID=1482730 RepID=A0ABS2NT80_9FIRM|nr:rhodanese-like domain-containing protein [Alkaliphilus hydrothermalis]MBM7616041.1 thiosulfate/3-mercaptopyruvate sulfurtransferase [Alkaliphilus hydrothermalis]
MTKRKILILGIILLMTLGIFVGCKGNISQTSEVPDELGDVKIGVITTEELAEKINDTKVVVVDIRPESAYIGWQLENEARGGHIKGAVDFPMAWASLVKEEELKGLLEKKGITPEKTVVVYDTKGEESEKMARLLVDMGYENVLNYQDGLAAWAADKSLPMDKLARFEKLVHPEWIDQLIQGKKPSTYEGNEYKIFEVAWGEPTDYTKGHIPGAYYLDTNLLEEEPIWNRVSDEAIEAMLLANGITHDTTVILYGQDTTPAARAASVMLYAGVKDVRILNGGYAAWVNAGFEEETGINVPEAVKSFGLEIPSNQKYIIDLEEAKDVLLDPKAELVSIRSWGEHIGETSGYSYITPKGRIKGDVWGHGGSDAYNMGDFRNVNNTMRNYHEINGFWRDYGITPDKGAYFYCGTGWRASEAFFAAYLMGWENIGVYDGGWYEWSMDEANPIVIGE